MSSYDYVVVGGGTAGCVVATHLSSNPDARVLLVEAGARHPLPEMATPPAWLTLLGGPADWKSVTVEQPGTGTVVQVPRGRAVGGSSSINGMVFARGHRSSYDAWTAAGAPGWGFDDLLPFFRRSESATGRAAGVRGIDGPMVVAPAAQPHPLAAAGLEAALEAGHLKATDISGGLEQGFGWTDLNIVEGARQSVADAYLRPVVDRPNLDVVTDALVHRIRVENGTCVGADYTVGGELISADCSGEVVLTTGTIGTAHLLLLSGIGPQAHLHQVGVDVVVDLPGVGENLHDHPVSGVVYSAGRSVPMGVNNHIEVLGLMRSAADVDAPDLQAFFLTPQPGVEDQYMIAFSAMAPRSRGTVRLARARPDAAPLLDPNYLGDSHDLEMMVTGLRLAREIGNQSSLGSWRDAEVAPGPGADGSTSREYLRAATQSYYHPVGTCRIGSDEMSVVDTDLRVRGISGLRVADASVMPSIPSANTLATVVAIAERAASLIQE
ncbi:GMC family oxidoreductase [Pseudonocardia alaniniphila]|uniref:GMC family oxidoreductase N-terminal domain-containing protein n=1 Tax=Pseudonocardia alaniniphila TaxID=75291 RepID=A0ABS9TT15_9PSEU|nr:GMC family oxidoreductase N-terminal domain-containing protein [Pseudonocardia alaniniphila]MCH6171396.1 GMC family oxidoreductase N-terminal domain-containing protein [Pseudonocardia alaniniphila]